MIVSTVRARIVQDTPGALEWARKMATFVKQTTGNEIDVLVRVGATQDVVWLQRHADLAAYEKAMVAVQSDGKYWAEVKEAQAKGFFDSPTVEAGIWHQA